MFLTLVGFVCLFIVVVPVRNLKRFIYACKTQFMILFSLLPAFSQVASRNDYDKTIQETEAAYLKILESSQTLLTVLKRESVSISKKSQGRQVSSQDWSNKQLDWSYIATSCVIPDMWWGVKTGRALLGCIASQCRTLRNTVACFMMVFDADPTTTNGSMDS